MMEPMTPTPNPPLTPLRKKTIPAGDFDDAPGAQSQEHPSRPPIPPLPQLLR